MRYEDKILELLESKELTCQEICSIIIATDEDPEDGWDLNKGSKSYLSGTISGTLLTMYRKGWVALGERKGPRGGNSYKLVNKLPC